MIRTARKRRSNVIEIVFSIAVVGSLFAIGEFAKPGVSYRPVAPPAIEKRDRLYGSIAAPGRGSVLWMVAPMDALPSPPTVELRGHARISGWRKHFSLYGRNVVDKYYVVTAPGQGDNVTPITGMPATYGVTFNARY